MGYYETHRDAIDYYREEYDCLSNFYPTKVVFDGITYYNSEAAYQAQKCLHPEDRLLFALLSSDEAKRFGQKVERRPDWDDVKCGIMEQIVYAKFTQNPTLAQALLDTGGVTIGDGCVIGAGSVVTRDIPPNSLAVGVPCHVVREITEADSLENHPELF